MRLSVFLMPLLCAAGLVQAQSAYDGLYRPAATWADGWDCQTVGSDGGAIAVQSGQFVGVGRVCDLADPVNVVNMDATLYNGQCRAEGVTTSERIMLMTTSRGIAVITDGSVAELMRCE